MGKTIVFDGLPPNTHTHFLTPVVIKEGVSYGGNLVNVWAKDQPVRFPLGYVEDRYVRQHVASGAARIEGTDDAPAHAPDVHRPSAPVPRSKPAEAD